MKKAKTKPEGQSPSLTFYTLRTAAEKLGVGRDTVQRRLTDLEAAGYSIPRLHVTRGVQRIIPANLLPALGQSESEMPRPEDHIKIHSEYQPIERGRSRLKPYQVRRVLIDADEVMWIIPTSGQYARRLYQVPNWERAPKYRAAFHNKDWKFFDDEYDAAVTFEWC